MAKVNIQDISGPKHIFLIIIITTLGQNRTPIL